MKLFKAHPSSSMFLPPRKSVGFTIIEILIALFIFSLVLSAIYSIWVGIIRGKKIVESTLAEVQRSRISMHAIEDAFLTVLMYADRWGYYAFNADTSGDDAFVSMVSRLPSSYPGVGRFAGGELVVRRVSFYTEQGPKGDKQLVMVQAPMLLETNRSGAEPYKLVLANDVAKFQLRFWDPQKSGGQWVDEWLSTNMVPPLVHITLGLGKSKSSLSSTEPHDIVSRIVAIPAVAVIGGQRPMPFPGPGGPNQGPFVPGGGQGQFQNPRSGPFTQPGRF
jgi:prepilin-type N-terminal cleavage/methylation domain-containing protein